MRRSTGTSDEKQAQKRLHDLEAELRREITRKVELATLNDPESAYQKAVKALNLREAPYAARMDQYKGVFFDNPILMSEAPSDPHEAEQAIQLMEDIAQEAHLAARRSPDLAITAKHLRRFDGHPPPEESVKHMVSAAISEIESVFGDQPDTYTISTFLRVFEQSLERRVCNGSLKPRSKAGRVKNIGQFQATVGDLPLRSLEAKQAYDFAKHLEEEGLSHSTIQTRISDVSTMLDEAVEGGHIPSNPFRGLRLSKFGTKGQNYAPLSDDLLEHLFTISKLPKDVRDVWAVLVCTGMRLDEIALCEVRQVKEKDGVTYIDLRNALVKNDNSRREVPICAALEPLIRSRLAGKKEDDRLFSFPIKESGKSRASEQCGYWMKKIDLNKLAKEPDARFTTHSLRGTFKDKLRDAEVGLEVNNAILGHDQHTVSASYGRGPSLTAKKDAVDRPAHPYLTWISEEYGQVAADD